MTAPLADHSFLFAASTMHYSAGDLPPVSGCSAGPEYMFYAICVVHSQSTKRERNNFCFLKERKWCTALGCPLANVSWVGQCISARKSCVQILLGLGLSMLSPTLMGYVRVVHIPPPSKHSHLVNFPVSALYQRHWLRLGVGTGHDYSPLCAWDR